eukprot:6200586-Pleurochrysis_carterae.AAC.4
MFPHHSLHLYLCVSHSLLVASATICYSRLPCSASRQVAAAMRAVDASGAGTSLFSFKLPVWLTALLVSNVISVGVGTCMLMVGSSIPEAVGAAGAVLLSGAVCALAFSALERCAVVHQLCGRRFGRVREVNRPVNGRETQELTGTEIQQVTAENLATDGREMQQSQQAFGEKPSALS